MRIAASQVTQGAKFRIWPRWPSSVIPRKPSVEDASKELLEIRLMNGLGLLGFPLGNRRLHLNAPVGRCIEILEVCNQGIAGVGGGALVVEGLVGNAL
jgi:hypothetical protein